MKIFIDPNDVLNKFDKNLFYKESFLLFSVLVAGKSSEMIKNKTNALIFEIIGDHEPESLFNTIIEKYKDNNFEEFINLLKKHKTGKYNLLLKFINDIKFFNINLNNCSIEDLEKISGIGKKSSRFFMMYNRLDQENIAVLDTHILKFLHLNGFDVPNQTPTGKKYDEIEQMFLEIAKNIEPKMTIRELDFKLWFYAKTYNKVPKVEKNKLIFY